jgi:hypothetical protein
MTGDAPDPGWTPANATEQQLLAALAVDDRRHYFEIIATAPLYLPSTAEPAAQRRPADPAQVPARDDPGQPAAPRYFTWDVAGQTYLPVFTSAQALAASLGDLVERYVLTNYAELSRYWPSPQWRLAVNPGHPIDAWLPIDAVDEAASGALVVSTVSEMRRAAAARDDADDDNPAMVDAALDGYLEALLKSAVVVAAAAPSPDPGAVLAGTFPWLVTQVSGQPTIAVYTSPAGFASAVPSGTPSAGVRFAELVAAWPNPSWHLVVDPGAEVSFTLPGEQVPGLLLWADVGTPDALPDVDE